MIGEREKESVMQEKYTERQMLAMEKPELTCADVTALLGDYVDNELPISLRNRIADKIDRCPTCEQNYLEYQQVVLLAREMREPPALPTDVQKRLRNVLNKRLGINLGG